MNCNLFNNKINLPRFCAKLGYTDYQYIKIPTFGWFAYNKDKTFIGNAFDIVSQKDREHLYALVTKEKPEYLDFDVAYSAMSESELKYDLFETQLWSAVFAYCKKELETYKVTYKGKRTLLKEVLEENGFSALLGNNVGVITTEVMEKFHMLPWPKTEMRGKLLIPSFCTPYHICSLEYCSWSDPTTLKTLWLNDEKGWYGNLGHKKIVKNLTELWSTPGNTWDYKADYWYPLDIITLSDSLDVADSIRVWAEANNTILNKSPLAHIVETGQIEELKTQLGKLSFKQLQEAEKATGESLVSHWRKARETQVKIGTKTFTRRDNCYWVYKKDRLEQVTNFVIEIDKITKKGYNYYRKGTIFFGKTALPFEMEEHYFTTNYLFHRGIKEKFLSSGLGIPIVHPDFFNKALLIIDSFNQGLQIDTLEGEQSGILLDDND